jgi:hypothetical protein
LEDLKEEVKVEGLKIYDKLGQEITVGSIIAYGHAIDRSAALRIGKVLAIKEKKDSWTYTKGVSITVWGVDDDWSRHAPRLLTKKGTLAFPERIIVLDETKLKPEYRDLLAKATLTATKKTLGLKSRWE